MVDKDMLGPRDPEDEGIALLQDIRHKCGSTMTRVVRWKAFTMQAVTVYFGPYDKDGSSVCKWEV